MQSKLKMVLKPAVRQARSIVRKLRLQRLRASGVEVDATVQIHGPLTVHLVEGSCVSIDARVVLNGAMRRNTLEARGPNVFKTTTKEASIIIGADTGLTSATISAATNVTVGQRVLIGAGVLITDSDHHLVSLNDTSLRRYGGFPQPRNEDEVHIEDDVFIGARSIILKGVTIGKGSVIGAGSVVSRSIPENVIAAGNPCRPVRSLGASAT